MLRVVPFVLFPATVLAEPPACEAGPGQRVEELHGEVERGDSFIQVTPAGWLFRLVPLSEGWLLQLTTAERPEEDLARLTPPFHFAPNPRQIEGWHLRNADNTGPNDGGTNAPQELREFIFSPRVGRDIRGADATASPTVDEVREVGSFGRGWLSIEEYTLTPVRRGERAAFESMRFSACIVWAG
jgi:hypothetical protein